jgi:putative transposase
MSWKTRALQYVGIPLHLYNRGVNGERIFRTDSDYEYWMELMAKALPRHAVNLHLQTLMPNHYHIGLDQIEEYEASWFMAEVSGKYARHFNKKYKRYGPVFAGRFHPVPVFDDAGILRLSYYMHMNPVNAGLCTKPEDWPYSSCAAYQNKEENGIIKLDLIHRLVGGPEEYREFLAKYDPSDPFSIHRFMKKENRMNGPEGDGPGR